MIFQLLGNPVVHWAEEASTSSQRPPMRLGESAAALGGVWVIVELLQVSDWIDDGR